MPPGPADYLPALAAAPAGTRMTVRVQPRASRTEIVGLHGGALRIRLAAPPVDGAANDALLRFLADRLGVARTTLVLCAGMAARTKIILIPQLTPSDVADRLFAGHTR